MSILILIFFEVKHVCFEVTVDMLRFAKGSMPSHELDLKVLQISLNACTLTMAKLVDHSKILVNS